MNNNNILSASGLLNTTKIGYTKFTYQQGASVEPTHVAVTDTGPLCEGEKNSQQGALKCTEAGWAVTTTSSEASIISFASVSQISLESSIVSLTWGCQNENGNVQCLEAEVT